MLNQKKVEIFLAKFHKSLAKQFLEVAFKQLISVFSWLGNIRLKTELNVKEKVQMLNPIPLQYI